MRIVLIGKGIDELAIRKALMQVLRTDAGDGLMHGLDMRVTLGGHAVRLVEVFYNAQCFVFR